jgi:hypothetical protein
MHIDPNSVITYNCAVCGEENEVEVELAGGRKQVFTEDCAVCCRPNVITCIIGEDGFVAVDVEFEG